MAIGGMVAKIANNSSGAAYGLFVRPVATLFIEDFVNLTSAERAYPPMHSGVN